MYSYNNEYRQPEYEQAYNNEWEMELDPEMEMESDTSYESDFENETDFENDYESDYESDFESGQGFDTEAEESYETDMESDQEFETDMEMEGESDYEQNLAAYSRNGQSQNQYESDLESELEFVTNEMEFENWVRKAVTRDHRNRNLTPIVRTPAGRAAIRQMSSIAARTLPRLGIRAGGWRGRPFVQGLRRAFNMPFVRPGMGDWRRRRRHYPYNRYNPYYGGGVNTLNMGPENMNSFQNTAPSQSPDGGGGGGMGDFRKFVMDTFKNLSEQIAMGNNNLAAIKDSIANSAANNLPGGQTGGQPPPADTGTPPPGNAPTPNTPPTGTQPEWETGDYEFDTEMEGEMHDHETGMNEEAEIELASELLSVGSERELDQFLGKALKAAFKGVSNLLGSKEGQLLKSALKKIAKKTLPGVGGAIGTFFGGPLGTTIGTKLGSDASQLFELELEGLSPEDREFETAKALVRLTDDAGKQLVENNTGNPEEDARAALIAASRIHAPGLITRRNRRRSGRRRGAWFRRGNRLIIEGI